MMGHLEKERLVEEYLDHGNKEAAIKLLFELSVNCAREKNFEAAEALRSRIYEIDLMALGEIIGSGEIIAAEKYKAIDIGHRKTWAGLYQQLSVEEANALYFALKHQTCQGGETISRQGELKSRLYFINSGRAKVVYFQEGREVFLKNVEPGQLAGTDVFFFLTLCTTTMTALCRTELSYLDSDVLNVWRTTSPLLESKLYGYASETDNIPDLLKAKAIDRRRLRRIVLSGNATAQIMNWSEEGVGKPFKVKMGDISRGGCCFYVRISKRETASLILGKRLRLSYVPPLIDASNAVEKCGAIVAVRFHPFEDCTVSVKFDSLLPEAVIEELETITTPHHALD
jgi:hypothetical protein